MQSEYIPGIIVKQVRFLDSRFVHKPKKMLKEFVLTYDFEDCSEYLWNLMKGFLTSEYVGELENDERSFYLNFYEQVAALIEATFLLYEKRIAKKQVKL